MEDPRDRQREQAKALTAALNAIPRARTIFDPIPLDPRTFSLQPRALGAKTRRDPEDPRPM